MQLGRTDLSATPLIGVVLVVFVVFVYELTFVPVDVPRRLDDLCPDEPRVEITPIVTLHADLSAELTERAGNTLGPAQQHLEARELPAALWRIANELPEMPQPESDTTFQNDWLPMRVVYLRPDDAVLWGDVVSTASSIAEITGGRVALDD